MNKVNESFEIYEDHASWIGEMVEKFDLEERGKAIRVLLDYAASDGNLDEIFANFRCRHC